MVVVRYFMSKGILRCLPKNFIVLGLQRAGAVQPIHQDVAGILYGGEQSLDRLGGAAPVKMVAVGKDPVLAVRRERRDY